MNNPKEEIAFSDKDFIWIAKASHEFEILSQFDQTMKNSWKEAASKNIMNYSVDYIKTKILYGNFNIVSQLNPLRKKKRRVPASIMSVKQGFDPSSFNFTRIEEKEILFEMTLLLKNEKSIFASVIVNTAPICSYHNLLVPNRMSSMPQVLNEEGLTTGIYSVLLSGTPSLKVGFNSLGGMASVNHNHWHIYYLPHPLPIETTKCKKLSGPVYIFTDHYAPGFIINIENFCVEYAVRNIMKIIDLFLHEEICHNVMITRGYCCDDSRVDSNIYNNVRICIWPRKSFYGVKQLPHFASALCEFSGHLPIYGTTPSSTGLAHAQHSNSSRYARIIQLCGFRANEGSQLGVNRIVGGSVAEKHEFKWQVSIQWSYKSTKYHVCGGAVIGQQWVLTAAHCTRDFRIETLLFVAGDYLMNVNEGTEQILKASKVFEHEQYDTVTQENDITLVKMERPFIFDPLAVAPVCLPAPQEKFTGSCVVSGWGKDREGGKNTDILQKVWLPIITNEQCRSKMKLIGYKGPVKDTMICAGIEEGGQDACQGDSGGPFVCVGKGNLPILAGIVSWGIGCARKDIPGVYTEVSKYVGWINQKISTEVSLSVLIPRPVGDNIVFWEQKRKGAQQKKNSDKNGNDDDNDAEKDDRVFNPNELQLHSITEPINNLAVNIDIRGVIKVPVNSNPEDVWGTSVQQQQQKYPDKNGNDDDNDDDSDDDNDEDKDNKLSLELPTAANNGTSTPSSAIEFHNISFQEDNVKNSNSETSSPDDKLGNYFELGQLSTTSYASESEPLKTDPNLDYPTFNPNELLLHSITEPINNLSVNNDIRGVIKVPVNSNPEDVWGTFVQQESQGPFNRPFLGSSEETSSEEKLFNPYIYLLYSRDSSEER